MTPTPMRCSYSYGRGTLLKLIDKKFLMKNNEKGALCLNLQQKNRKSG